MRSLLLLMVCAALLAAGSDDAPQATGGKPTEASSQAQPADAPKPADADKSAGTPVSPLDSLSSFESNFTGSIDIGYRYRWDVGGSQAAYRSVVDLGSGLKIFGADFVLLNPTHQVFDRFELHGSNWFDPYNTVRASVSLTNVYSLTFDYRDINYYNFLPSFANVSIGQGIYLNQQSFDMRQKTLDTQLDLWPGRWLQPYVAFGHYSNDGIGISDYVLPQNQYALPYTSIYSTENLRGGFRFEFPKWHVTLEGGGTQYRDYEQLVDTTEGVLFGNRSVPYLGQTLTLNNASTVDQVKGNSGYGRGTFTASPFKWLDLSGQFLYSQPSLNAVETEVANGVIVTPDNLGFLTALNSTLNAYAQQPHTTGGFGVEMRPLKRIRILESFSTDRLHSSGTLADPPYDVTRLVSNYSQNEINVLFDVARWLTIRGGYRYVWGDSIVPISDLGDPPGLTSEQGNLKRNVVLAGVAFVPNATLRASWDFEKSFGDNTAYFLTSLTDYTKSRINVRYKPLEKLQVSFISSVLKNSAPTPVVANNSSFWTNGASLSYTPVKSINVVAEYSYTDISTNYGYLDPITLNNALSAYAERAHTASAYVELGFKGFQASLGGSLFTSGGSRPTSYYQPLARLSYRINKYLDWKSEWHYYGLGETLYPFEGFRTNTFATGLRLSKN
jgi:hypothetical protein